MEALEFVMLITFDASYPNEQTIGVICVANGIATLYLVFRENECFKFIFSKFF